jgi:hypothetical protein
LTSKEFPVTSATLEQARAAKAKAAETFGQVAPVVGVGITRSDGGFALKINLQKAPAPGASVPDSVDGVPVQVEIVGTIRKR